MRICVAQTKAVKGDISINIKQHVTLIKLAVSSGASLIIFPELSLTGYEPTLARSLAITAEDERLTIFQELSDKNDITIGIGAPTFAEDGICISLILFQPGKQRMLYSKKYLHPDEEEFFVRGKDKTRLQVKGVEIGLAICYEISVPEHTQAALKNGEKLHIASVAKFVNGIDRALDTLSGTARKYSATVLMSNCIGYADGALCAGRSSVWSETGELLCQLGDSQEGILILDLDKKQVLSKLLEQG